MALLNRDLLSSSTKTDLPQKVIDAYSQVDQKAIATRHTGSRAFTGSFDDLGIFWGSTKLAHKLTIEFYVANDEGEITYYVASNCPPTVGMGGSLTHAFGDWCREATEFRERARLVRQPWPEAVSNGVEAFDSWVPFV